MEHIRFFHGALQIGLDWFAFYRTLYRDRTALNTYIERSTDKTQTR